MNKRTIFLAVGAALLLNLIFPPVEIERQGMPTSYQGFRFIGSMNSFQRVRTSQWLIQFAAVGALGACALAALHVGKKE